MGSCPAPNQHKRFRLGLRPVLACMVTVLLLGCSPGNDGAAITPEPPVPAPEPLRMAAAANIEPIAEVGLSGRFTFEQVQEFVRIEGQLEGLEEGQYGFHIHVGHDCDARGGHYDPTDRPHGGPDEPADLRHVGDLGNLVSRDGLARYYRIDPVLELTGEHSIIGRVLVVHAERDKFLPQPTGDAGAQIGCGIIEPTRVTASASGG